MRIVFARARALVGLELVCVCMGVTSCAGTARSHLDPKGTRDSGAGPFSEAPHAPLPQLVFQGGPLLSAMEIVTVTFPNDPNAAALEAFDDDLVTSSWWGAVTPGFCDQSGACVGKGHSGGHARIPTPPAASYTDATGGGSSSLQRYIADQISQGVLPPATANTLYVFYFPTSTLITLTESGLQTVASCAQFTGYHNAINTPGGWPPPVAYAVVQACPQAQGSTLTPLEALTFTASHEIIEAATDPTQLSNTHGYYLNLNDRTVRGWDLLAGGEAGDLCSDVTGLHQDQTTVDGYAVQRIWSNPIAAKGLDPCVPTVAHDVYFNVAPKAGSAFLVLYVGGTATFEADAFSTEAMSSWTLQGVDWATKLKLLKAPLLSFLFNGQKTATVNNGDKIQITVTLDADPAQLGGAEGVLLSTSGPSNAPTAAHAWPILVVTPAEADGGS